MSFAKYDPNLALRRACQLQATEAVAAMTDSDLDKLEAWLAKATRPVMIMHPDDALAGGDALREKLAAARIGLNTSPLLQRGKILLVDGRDPTECLRTSLLGL